MRVLVLGLDGAEVVVVGQEGNVDDLYRTKESQSVPSEEIVRRGRATYILERGRDGGGEEERLPGVRSSVRKGWGGGERSSQHKVSYMS